MLIQTPSGSFTATGRATKNAELQEVGSKKSLLMTVSIATGDNEFLTAKAWNPIATHWGNYVKKGMSVFVAGRKEISSYEDKNTGEQKQSTTYWIEFIAEQMMPQVE